MTQLPPGASPVDAITPGTRLREWEVVGMRGRGSYGVVFEARRSSWLDEPHRALKVFDPIISTAARNALLGEFSTLTDIRHEHLLSGIDAFDLDQPPYAGCVVFVLELADEDLTHRLARLGALPAPEVAAIGVQVADGLAALHSMGRIHGDVKPENVLRVADRWVLGDFGVTSVLEGSYALAAGTTVDYRPPEMAAAPSGDRLHRSADIWALGVTLHVAATGRHPFPGPDPMMRYAAVVRGDRLPSPEMDPTLAQIVDGMCLVPDPRRRIEASDLAQRLRGLVPAGGVSFGPPPAATYPRRGSGQFSSRERVSAGRTSTGEAAPEVATSVMAAAATAAVVSAVAGLSTGALSGSLATKRGVYLAASLLVLAVAAVVAVRSWPPLRHHLAWSAAAAAAVWAVATVLLFGVIT